MLKKIHTFLKCFIFVQLGAFFGDSLAEYINYRRYPERYEIMSAPWYTQILISALLTAIAVFLTALAYFILGRIIKKKKAQNNTEVTN